MFGLSVMNVDPPEWVQGRGFQSVRGPTLPERTRGGACGWSSSLATSVFQSVGK